MRRARSAGVCRSGVAERSSDARAHRSVSIALWLFQTFDQYDLANLAGGEFLTRRLLQMEAATPRHVVFEGIGGIFDTALDDDGSVIALKFITRTGAQHRTEVAVLVATVSAHQGARGKRGGGGNLQPPTSTLPLACGLHFTSPRGIWSPWRRPRFRHRK